MTNSGRTVTSATAARTKPPRTPILLRPPPRQARKKRRSSRSRARPPPAARGDERPAQSERRRRRRHTRPAVSRWRRHAVSSTVRDVRHAAGSTVNPVVVSVVVSRPTADTVNRYRPGTRRCPGELRRACWTWEAPDPNVVLIGSFDPRHRLTAAVGAKREGAGPPHRAGVRHAKMDAGFGGGE